MRQQDHLVRDVIRLVGRSSQIAKCEKIILKLDSDDVLFMLLLLKNLKEVLQGRILGLAHNSLPTQNT